MIDFLRRIRSFFSYFSELELFGVPLDLPFHFAVGFAGFLLLRPWLGVKRSAISLGALMLAKELADVFAKSRLEYIRPPTLDFVLDLVFGLLGISAAYGAHLIWSASKHDKR